MPQRAAVRRHAVPDGRGPHAGLRHHEPRQPRARLALHGRRLPGERRRPLDGAVSSRGGVRAVASYPTMVAALGVNIRLLYTVVFGFGAALAALGGLMAGPIYAVLPGMGEEILIQVFVVIVIGGIGSIRGALAGAVVVGMVDTLGRAFLKPTLS